MIVLKRIVRIFFLILSACGLICFLIPFYCGVLNIGNGTGILLCTVVFLTSFFFGKIGAACRKSRPFRVSCRIVLVVFLIGVCWTVFLTGLMVYGSVGMKPRAGATVVVLGSKVNGKQPSADLRVRIETAASYLKANPKAKCVVSGGKGAGELATEASVMRAELIVRGIEPSRIFAEDASRTTRENLQNSLAVIDKNGLSRDLAIVTDDYHQYRAGRIAESLGVSHGAVNAATPWYILSACYMRELLALTKFLLLP
ncbi:YdcF family protein [Caproiciproducens galactitolivorans]|uniref:Vancomycin high temperature exclusion protein n=1 Tax=Caproiciproducens galactitolivorans TaxID=642589 RepID=A0A4Z0YKM9_9FIRM|nr:YdcF family protein [Caproiciproducens galactitolivorans]TGJ77392.1 vancomycin high temperature exclusion protein [Caproiciproducens galactitolivorans]